MKPCMNVHKKTNMVCVNPGTIWTAYDYEGLCDMVPLMSASM